jgi:hypothetical protein
MQTFISETIENILKTTSSFNNVVLILPSQRAGVYVKQTIKDAITAGFLPEIVTIEEFLETVSNLKKVDTLQLLFDFYTIYKDTEKDPVSFDNFSSWAFTVLQDFNEIDQYLIDTDELFVYLRDLQRLKKWSVKGEFKETELVKNHHSFLEKLNLFYPKLYAHLLNNKSGYQGLIYREATKSIDTYLSKNSKKSHIFIGFNALNKAEEYLIQKVLEVSSSAIYWDIDEQFLNSNHQAGNFIRKYSTQWNYYQKRELKIVGSSFNNPKEIKVLGVSKNITQIKHAGEILSTLSNYNNTAFVLGDESLLPVALSSLPEKVHDINITMGYPLKNIPTVQLIHAVFQLFLSQERLQKKEGNVFFYKDVLNVFKNATFANYLKSEKNISNEISNYIISENASFLSQDILLSILKNRENQLIETIRYVFDPIEEVSHFLDKILLLINSLKEETSALEKEYLYRFYQVFTQLKNLQNEHSYFKELKTLYQFFKQLISTENLFFQGEPLKGLQLMGMLETRVLDFENVIITSVNEGNLPGNSTTNSFIPFDVKIHFGIPTYKEKDAIFSYHFFRLLQRAKNVFILYNTENDSYGNGEKSRFLKQLELMRNDIIYKNISAKIHTEKTELIEVSKDASILEQLKVLAQKGISPSALTNYLYNPIAFYKQKILKLKEVEEIEETVAANTLGSVIHDVLDELYKPHIGTFIKEALVNSMLDQTPNLISKYFKKYFKSGDLTTGKNRLIYEVANRFVERFLRKELEVVRKNSLKIIATEEQLEATINVNGLDFPIKIKGIVDRVDELNGVIRVVDYKTGVVKASGLKLGGVIDLEDYKYSKAIQVLLYTYLYIDNKKFPFDTSITAGIFSFKNLKSGFLEVNFSEKRGIKDIEITPERLDDFMQKIEQLLLKIYDPKNSFKEPVELLF